MAKNPTSQVDVNIEKARRKREERLEAEQQKAKAERQGLASQLDTNIEKAKQGHAARDAQAAPGGPGGVAAKVASLPGRYLSWMEKKNLEADAAAAKARAAGAPPPQQGGPRSVPYPQQAPSQEPTRDPAEMVFGASFGGGQPPQRPQQKGKGKKVKQPQVRQPEQEPVLSPEQAMENANRMMRDMFS